ncbi:solute carrier organic anion transporter family member 1C1-like [Melitaea cinxia]|uniref:solute carrier organic anion transporter family member 1C1-like n=1 Tax=Melitaea cinxia TaxID=113334 RepID=UPI001E271AFB|nr:solute carrier organic anion transporter family member 1C1-like [Melitaea cinxia]
MVSYVSPCQAGCRESQEINGIQVYSNCTCAGGGRVLERACGDEPCRNASLMHGLMFYMLFMVGILTLQGQGVLLLKIVDPRDKSVAQGLAFSFVAILTFVVGHTIFYGLQSVLLISRIFPLVLGHKVLTDAVENNMILQTVALSMGSLSSLVQLPCVLSNKAPEVNGLQMEELPLTNRGLWTSIRRVLYNPIAITQILAMGLVTASLWGYGYYELDIIKYAGTVFSAPILMEFSKLKALKQAAIMSVLMFVFYILIITVPRCDTGNVVGVGKNYYGHPECSLACHCKPQWDEFKPVCAVDNMVGYVSPCQAGCRESQKINGIQVYSNCTCARGGRVLERACGDEPCRKAHLLHGLMYNMLVAFAILVLQAQGVLLLKVVDPRDKSVALGLACSFVAIMTFAVGHAIFYGLYVRTCRWFQGNKCHLQSEAFPYLIGATCAFLILTSIFTTVTSWHFIKLSNKDRNEVFETRL